MAITLSAIGIAAILGRRIIESRLSKNDTHQQRFLTGLRMAGATCVLLIGISLFVYTLRGKMPGVSAGLYRNPQQQQVLYQDERDRRGSRKSTEIKSKQFQYAGNKTNQKKGRET
jgi:hypothetical protein